MVDCCRGERVGRDGLTRWSVSIFHCPVWVLTNLLEGDRCRGGGGGEGWKKNEGTAVMREQEQATGAMEFLPATSEDVHHDHLSPKRPFVNLSFTASIRSNLVKRKTKLSVNSRQSAKKGED